MSQYSSPADGTNYYESIHSAPRRLSAGVFRPDIIPLPPLSRTLTGSSTATAAPSVISSYDGPGQSPNNDTSYLWPWYKPRASLDDREKMPLAVEEKAGSRKPSMRLFEGWKVVFMGSWFNVLLLLLPASWIVDSVSQESHTLVFVFCILSMMPLVRLHDLATNELAIRLGGSKAGLLNASLSNIVELVIAATALRKCELRVVQSSLIGSMLSKLLMVLGMCFFAGGLRFTEQGFDVTATQVHSSLLSISVGAILMPAAYHFSLSWRNESTAADQKAAILKMSHGVSVVLVAVYCAYLLFQLWSHTHLFKDVNNASNRHAVKRPRLPPRRRSQFREKERSGESSGESSPGSRAPSPVGVPNLGYRRSFASASDISLPVSSGTSSSLGYVYSRGTATPAPALGTTVKLVRDGRCAATRLPSGENLNAEYRAEDTIHEQSDEEQRVEGDDKAGTQDAPGEEKPQLSWTVTLLLLVIVTVLVAIDAEWLVESMNELSGRISKEWIALILLPMMNGIAECLTAINVSRQDRLTLSISVAVGSTIQTALFVIPFMVILGWVLGKPLPLLFDPFESIVLYISVHVMTYVVADGKSNWLEGAILICFYINIAVSFWFYPGSNYSDTLGTCTMDLKR